MHSLKLVFLAITSWLLMTEAPVKATSLTVFTVANTYCEKKELGMSVDDAMLSGLREVMLNQNFDPDYKLPNFPNLVSMEIYRLCPKYMIQDFATP